MGFRCWWSCFPKRRSRYWMNGSSWIINLKRVGFSPAVKQLSPLIFRGAIISIHELSAIIKYIYQVKSCEANISQIWTIMQSKPFPSWPGDLFRSVALRGGEGTNHHCRGGLSSVSSRRKGPDLCFLLQSHRDMMCFQSPDWGFNRSIHFLRRLSVFLKSHELFQVVSVGAGTILANGVELNILPLGPGVITYLPPWKLVEGSTAFQGDELEPPVKVAWLTCCEDITKYHNWVEDLAKSFEMLAKWLKQPKYLHFFAAECFIFAYSCSSFPSYRCSSSWEGWWQSSLSLWRWGGQQRLPLRVKPIDFFLLPLPQDSKQIEK